MELRIGIDASINSTGFVLMVLNGGEISETDYFMITPKLKKDSLCSTTATLKTYNRFWPNKKSTYSQTDIYKILSAENLSDVMIELIKNKMDEYNHSFEKVSCRIEGSIMASSFKGQQARLNDLVAFGSVMRLGLIKSGLLTEIAILPPKTLKKLVTGNGNAKKEDMIRVHKEQYESEKFDYSKGKVDDIIDAFWLAKVPVVLNIINETEFNFNKYNKNEAAHIIALYNQVD